ncbi:tyrosine-protein kinase Fer-like isoform X2 [Schistocerca gregaria]|uniref:tyrosine-protein kinase Fer-like isoform X2 n=1 Tax=Schistocerca gregaria TaxID=7010 RepID=UPI00211EE509|nr:tyrosine-protein kinase Fer-like isoform X2 [Schistocerca gregaria]
MRPVVKVHLIDETTILEIPIEEINHEKEHCTLYDVKKYLQKHSKIKHIYGTNVRWSIVKKCSHKRWEKVSSTRKLFAKEFLEKENSTVLSAKKMLASHFKYTDPECIQLYQVISGFERFLPNEVDLIDYAHTHGRIVMTDTIQLEARKNCWLPRFSTIYSVNSVVSLISNLQKGNKLSHASMNTIAEMFFSNNPIFVMALEECWIYEESELWLGFEGFNYPILKFSNSPLDQHEEYVKRIRLKNLISDYLSIEVILYPSKGDFLGYKQSQKVLRPHEEARISFYLVPLLSSITTGLIIISCCKLQESGRQTNSCQYYIVKYQEQVLIAKESKYWRIVLSELLEDRKHILGMGSSSVVYKANLYGQELACKVLKEQGNLGDMNTFFREVEHLCNPDLRHPNIIMFYGASDRRPFRIITELLECTLTSLLRAEHIEVEKRFHSGLTWKRRIQLALDIICAVEHLHKCGYVHRDLKSLNIMISSNFTAKIADLGNSEKLNSEGKTRGIVGTVPWMAPEVILSEEYGTSADIYSFGVTLFEIVSKKPLFDHCIYTEKFELYEQINKWYEGLSEEPEKILGSLVMKCCHKIPNYRCVISEIYMDLKKALSIAERTSNKAN